MNVGDTVRATITVPIGVIAEEITVKFVRPDKSVAAERTLADGVTVVQTGNETRPAIYKALYNADVPGTWRAVGRVVSGDAVSNPQEEFYISKG